MPICWENLKNEVDNAIKIKDISVINAMDGEIQKKELRYMQKYAELQVSKKESRISFESYFIGMDSLILTIIAIGISYFLFGISKIPTPEIVYLILGLGMAILGLWLKYKRVPQKKIEFEEMRKDIDFMHIIILKIEEKFP